MPTWTPWITSVREALDRERRSAVLDRNDLALKLGRHAELLNELIEDVERQPLDERLAGQLLLALYRSGRQADALHHSQNMRDRLADELGGDPSLPLRHLHERILYLKLGELPQALRCLNKGLTLCRTTSDRHGEARILTSIGEVHGRLRHNAEALDHHNNALALV